MECNKRGGAGEVNGKKKEYEEKKGRKLKMIRERRRENVWEKEKKGQWKTRAFVEFLLKHKLLKHLAVTNGAIWR